MPIRQTTTASAPFFYATDPLRPPTDNGAIGRLGAIVSEATTWFFAEPIIERDRPPADHGPRQLTDISDAIEVAHGLLRQRNIDVQVSFGKKVVQCDRRGFQLVDLFCDRHMRKEGAFFGTLGSGRVVNQRHLLCAMVLHQAEQAARAVENGDTTSVCNLMEDILQLVCEVRRALDRETGSTIAARRARQRHEKHDRIRTKACELYDQQEWRSVRKAAQWLFEKQIQKFSVEIGAPLSTDSGELTVYKWLRAHKKRSACVADV